MLFTLFILLFLLLFSLTESLLMRYHLISYDRKPLICQSKTYETERDNCIWLYSYRWYVKFLLFTLFILLFYCYFCRLNLYSSDITWFHTTRNLWTVNQSPELHNNMVYHGNRGILKHVVWRFRIYNYFREIFKFRENMNKNRFREIS